MSSSGSTRLTSVSTLQKKTLLDDDTLMDGRAHSPLPSQSFIHSKEATVAIRHTSDNESESTSELSLGRSNVPSKPGGSQLFASTLGSEDVDKLGLTLCIDSSHLVNIEDSLLSNHMFSETYNDEHVSSLTKKKGKLFVDLSEDENDEERENEGDDVDMDTDDLLSIGIEKSHHSLSFSHRPLPLANSNSANRASLAHKRSSPTNAKSLPKSGSNNSVNSHTKLNEALTDLTIRIGSQEPNEIVSQRSLSDREKDKSQAKQLKAKLRKLEKKIKYQHEIIDKLELKKKSWIKQLPEHERRISFNREHSVKMSDIAEHQKKIEEIDAIDYLKKGTPMLKYGRRGYPHFRHFEITPDLLYMRWYTKAKRLCDSQVLLSGVDLIQYGQLTPVFRRHLQPRLSKCSFSLVYENGHRTLDVIARSRADFQIWSAGLSKLIQYNKEKLHDPQVHLERFILSVAVRPTGHVEKKLGLQPGPPARLVKKELTHAYKRYKNLEALLQQFQKEDVELSTRLNELHKVLDLASINVSNESFAVASHEIWKIVVELKTLETKVKILLKE